MSEKEIDYEDGVGFAFKCIYTVKKDQDGLGGYLKTEIVLDHWEDPKLIKATLVKRDSEGKVEVLEIVEQTDITQEKQEAIQRLWKIASPSEESLEATMIHNGYFKEDLRVVFAPREIIIDSPRLNGTVGVLSFMPAMEEDGFKIVCILNTRAGMAECYEWNEVVDTFSQIGITINNKVEMGKIYKI